MSLRMNMWEAIQSRVSPNFKLQKMKKEKRGKEKGKKRKRER